MASRKGYRLQTKRDNYRAKARGFDVTKKQQKRYTRLANKYDDKLTRFKASRSDISYRARQYNVLLSSLKTFFIVVLVFFLFNFLTNQNYKFEFFSFIDTLANMPLISITEISNLDFPNWLNWLEPFVKGTAILGTCTLNIAIMVVWLVFILFGIPI